MNLLLVMVRLYQWAFAVSTLKKYIRIYRIFDGEKISGAVIGREMLNFLESKELSVEDLIGQCYDVAPNMQSDKKGMA